MSWNNKEELVGQFQTRPLWHIKPGTSYKIAVTHVH